jgi:ABC-type uncharacterized transport system YnjBCD permease subunit
MFIFNRSVLAPLGYSRLRCWWFRWRPWQALSRRVRKSVVGSISLSSVDATTATPQR